MKKYIILLLISFSTAAYSQSRLELIDGEVYRYDPVKETLTLTNITPEQYVFLKKQSISSIAPPQQQKYVDDKQLYQPQYVEEKQHPALPRLPGVPPVITYKPVNPIGGLPEYPR